jgi:NAD+ synthase (glutamine-hydrolysing)
MKDYLRVSCSVPEIEVANVTFNTKKILEEIDSSLAEGVELLLFPELSLSSYTCSDLFYQTSLLQECLKSLEIILAHSQNQSILSIVGLPLLVDSKLFNVSAVIYKGEILGVVPKTYLPNTNEFYEERWFSSELDRTSDFVYLFGKKIPFGADLLFTTLEFSFGIEICEDVWVVNPPSNDLTLAGATLILNPSASPEILGKKQYRKDLLKQQSARTLSAYLYSSSGANESSTDLVYSGHALILENGNILSESERFNFNSYRITSDVDLKRLEQERIKNNSFSISKPSKNFRKIFFDSNVSSKTNILQKISPTPFIPSDNTKRKETIEEIFAIQSTALCKRLKHTKTQNVVIGISGGLDSTLALLVVYESFKKLNLSYSGIHTITMPGFGTTDRTYQNAIELAKILGTNLKEVSILTSVNQHFIDIGHDPKIHDITYENSQARERTQILMDYANKVNGLVIGTGDLSELALGWCTYNGDHMSMYAVNIGVPKTLIQYMIEWYAKEHETNFSKILVDIYKTPVSPELLPSNGNEILQKTEDVVGPYLLHDFFIYYFLRFSYSPTKIFFLAKNAFQNTEFTPEIILKWLNVFYRRFFSQQFKRSALPDGPKVGTVAVSPRGDLRMPSDASLQIWLEELEKIKI